MGKKRKAGGRPSGGVQSTKSTAPEKSKFAYEETFDDSGDEFQAGRDHILLDEAPEAKRRRKLAEQEEFFQPSDEEIMGYDSVDEDDLEEEDIGEDDVQGDDDDDMGMSRSKRRADDDEEEEEGIAAWGSSKKDLYNADQIETEIDAKEEEEEAKRLQQKHLQAMKDEDFGFDETEWATSGNAQEAEDDTDTGAVTEVLPQMSITDNMPMEERLKLLKSRYPEFEPLAKDFTDLQTIHRALEKSVRSFRIESLSEDDILKPAPVEVVKLRALTAYLGAVSLYFMLLTSPAHDAKEKTTPLPPNQMREHPVMGSLVEFRKLWESVKGLTESDDNYGVGLANHKTNAPASRPTATMNDKTTKKTKSLQESTEQKRIRLTKAQRAVEAAKAEAVARKAERLRETEAGLADLSNLVNEASKKRKTQKQKVSANEGDGSDFGDEDALTGKEAEEKANQKRSLRFYTSQIAQKANRRNAAGRDAGGDADIPYRERLKDRQARLNAEAERRGKRQPDSMQDLGGDSDEDDRRAAAELRGDKKPGGRDDDEDEYYDMVASRTKQRKDDKKAMAEAYAAAAREGGQVEIQEEIGPDGKRAITYQIAKNKGLAPKRKKDVRNPRVKKRKKFEEKKKKLGSIRQVYKGGEGRGGYGGELTGIKKNLVKSIKL